MYFVSDEHEHIVQIVISPESESDHHDYGRSVSHC